MDWDFPVLRESFKIIHPFNLQKAPFVWPLVHEIEVDIYIIVQGKGLTKMTYGMFEKLSKRDKSPHSKHVSGLLESKKLAINKVSAKMTQLKIKSNRQPHARTRKQNLHEIISW